MSPTRQIFLNILAPSSRVLCVLLCGVVVDRWVVGALGKHEFGLHGVSGGMTIIVLLAFTMRLVRVGNAAVGGSSMWAEIMGEEYYCGNLLWQSCRTVLSSTAKSLMRGRRVG